MSRNVSLRYHLSMSLRYHGHLTLNPTQQKLSSINGLPYCMFIIKGFNYNMKEKENHFHLRNREICIFEKRVENRCYFCVPPLPACLFSVNFTAQKSFAPKLFPLMLQSKVASIQYQLLYSSVLDGTGVLGQKYSKSVPPLPLGLALQLENLCCHFPLALPHKPCTLLTMYYLSS